MKFNIEVELQTPALGEEKPHELMNTGSQTAEKQICRGQWGTLVYNIVS